ncbi:MAG: hypothetical protein JXM79_20825, partial [Sedimentisphaerales bacterium]|nr:hypothetical protein [Sedimentisphaerales bacterium]
MKRPENEKWLDEVLNETIGEKKPRTDFEQWKLQHPDAVKMLTSRADRKASASPGPLTTRRMIMNSPITKIAAAAVVLLAVLIGIGHFGNSNSGVVWAEVAEHFESVPFFHLTMYMGYDTSGENKKIEIWKSEDSRVRAQEGDTVIFADLTKKENNILIYDRSTKTLVDNAGDAPKFLMMLCRDGQFSLNTLTSSFPPEVKGITPMTSAETAASRETVLFEAKHETTPERLTIWALRQSKLPIRACFSDPRKSEYGDFFFDYSERKDP